MSNKSNNNFVRLPFSTKKIYESLSIKTGLCLNDIIDSALLQHLSWLKFLNLKDQGVKRINQLKNEMGKYSEQEIRQEVEDIVHTVMTFVADEIIGAYEELTKSLDDPLTEANILLNTNFEKGLSILESSLKAERVNVNFDSPECQQDFKEWKDHDKSEEGFQRLVQKYTRLIQVYPS